jgi:hypothetical protein
MIGLGEGREVGRRQHPVLDVVHDRAVGLDLGWIAGATDQELSDVHADAVTTTDPSVPLAGDAAATPETSAIPTVPQSNRVAARTTTSAEARPPHRVSGRSAHMLRR